MINQVEVINDNMKNYENYKNEIKEYIAKNKEYKIKNNELENMINKYLKKIYIKIIIKKKII